MARVLLTGATGFVGGRVAGRLLAWDHEVVAPVRTSSTDLTTLGAEQHLGGFDAVTPQLLADIEVIVHAAASAGPDLATATAANVDGTRRLWELGRRVGVPRFVHVSTTSVYAPHPDAPIVDEDAPLVGDDDEDASPYARTKAGAERLLLTAGTPSELTILRPPAVLGAGATSTWGRRVPAAIRDGRGFPQPRAATFAFVHVEDLVDAVLAATGVGAGADGEVAGHRASGPIVANVVGGHVTVGDYLDAVVDLLPTEVAVRPGTDEPAWTGRYATDRLPRHLGVAPHRSFRSAMDEIAADWAERPDDQEVPG
ncbi:MAG: NAD-dependent epimerase/dehydratase family protein [Actinomycetota bacterium]